jgi:TrpR-related protein YerC/YecD
MSQISKYPIRKEISDRIFEIFFKTLSRTKNEDESYCLAEDLFTHAERIMLSKRLAIAFLLMKGYQYKSISDLLKVSTGTIATVNGYINGGKGGYKIVLDRISKEEQLGEFFNGMAEKLVALPALSTKGGGVWRAANNEIKKNKRLKHKAF